MTDQELLRLVMATGKEAEELWAEADRVRRQSVGDAVHLRGIIEFSNYCCRHCLYCGLRADNRRLRRYRLTPEQILAACRQIQAFGMGTVVLQSGEDPWWTAERLAELIRTIKAETGLAVTLSVGERDPETYRLWREAGADRYLLKHETANPALYARLHPQASYAARLRCHDALFALGYQVGAGNIVGLPGQTPEMLVEDLRLMEARQYHMCGIGPFLPHPDTPLGEAPPGSVERTLNVLALTRLLIPDAMLPATTALETLAPGARRQALRAGANVIMPNMTPREVAAAYEIYPGKQAPHLSLEAEVARTLAVIEAAGRSVASGPGHSPRLEAEGETEKARQAVREPR